MNLSSIILAISSSVDSLGIGITYGIKNTKITYVSNIIMFIIAFMGAKISIYLGSLIKTIFSEGIAKFIGSFILTFMGIFMMIQAIRKNENTEYKCEEHKESEKIYQIFIKFLGITIQIIKNPTFSDFDKSKKIEAKEALFLGLALSLDSMCIGTGSSIVGIDARTYPFLISSFQLLFLSVGNLFGKRLNKIKNVPDNIWSIMSGVLLVGIGIVKMI